MNTTLIATVFPFVPTTLADTLEGQADWWLCGFFVAQVFCAAGEMIRHIRKAKGSNYAP